jgi:hypothetical protein
MQNSTEIFVTSRSIGLLLFQNGRSKKVSGSICGLMSPCSLVERIVREGSPNMVEYLYVQRFNLQNDSSVRAKIFNLILTQMHVFTVKISIELVNYFKKLENKKLEKNLEIQNSERRKSRNRKCRKSTVSNS